MAGHEGAAGEGFYCTTKFDQGNALENVICQILFWFGELIKSCNYLHLQQFLDDHYTLSHYHLWNKDNSGIQGKKFSGNIFHITGLSVQRIY